MLSSVDARSPVKWIKQVEGSSIKCIPANEISKFLELTWKWFRTPDISFPGLLRKSPPHSETRCLGDSLSSCFVLPVGGVFPRNTLFCEQLPVERSSFVPSMPSSQRKEDPEHHYVNKLQTQKTAGHSADAASDGRTKRTSDRSWGSTCRGTLVTDMGSLCCAKYFSPSE